MGEFYFQLLHSEPHEKQWHYDSDGNNTYTMLKKNNSFVEGFRKWGFMAQRNCIIEWCKNSGNTLPRGRGDVLDCP